VSEHWRRRGKKLDYKLNQIIKMKKKNDGCKVENEMNFLLLQVGRFAQQLVD